MLYYLDPADKSALSEVRPSSLHNLGWSEKDLENLVSRHIDRIVREDQLLVIHQERRYQEEPDILALDREGNLHIFELKRWKSSQENLLQVLRYGQLFGQYDYRALDYLFKNYTVRIGGTPRELATSHQEHFELPDGLARSAFNQTQYFVVMTDGVDRATRAAVAYWGKHGLTIRAFVYHVYKTASGDVLFEITAYAPEGDSAVEGEDGLTVVNTNATYMPDAWRGMIDAGKASAYYGRKTAVEGISRGVPIALYHTGVGIIAFGHTTDTFRRASVGSDADEEYYVPCKWETFVDPTVTGDRAVRADEINAHLQASHRFRQTVYTLPPKSIEYIRKELERRAKLALPV
jgi:hypothetical protein